MPQVHLLSGVDPIAVSIVRKGANRKMWFLRKEDGSVTDELPDGIYDELIALDGDPHVIAKEDWSVAYCVVAEPGARESAGLIGDQDIEDEWANADEIQKAAHRFMKNGALVNKLHEDLEPYGKLVENAVALADLTVNGEVIKAGSWYVAIEPTADGRTAIENGEFTGVSLQGTGTRTLVEKTIGPPGTDIARNEGKQNGPLKNLIKFYLTKPHPFTSCVRDNRKRFGPATERVCAALKDIGLQTTSWRSSPHGGLSKADAEVVATGTVTSDQVPHSLYTQVHHIWTKKHGLHMGHARGAWVAVRAADKAKGTNMAKTDGLLKKLAARVGLTDDEIDEALAADIEKATFDDFMTAVDVRDELWDGMSALRQSIIAIIDPDGDGDVDIDTGDDDSVSAADAATQLEQTCDEFKAWLLDLVKQPDKSTLHKMREELAAEVGTFSPADKVQEQETTVDTETKDKFEKLEKDLGDTTEAVTKLVDRLEPHLAKAEAAEAPKVEDLAKTVGQLADGLKTVTEGLSKLAAGDSTQPEDETLTDADRAAIAKGDDNALAKSIFGK